MRVVFRADASVQIGTGHVMRCLTLADALRDRGVDTLFICRELAGFFAGMITARGHSLRTLPAPEGTQQVGKNEPAHAHWLEVSWEQDAEQSRKILQEVGGGDWLVVDHYGLDYRWESQQRLGVQKILVVDDLADRKHDCDILVDQTLAASTQRYKSLVPLNCDLLLGPRYAMLRPEFALNREDALQKRKKTSSVRKILVAMGGTDPFNVTDIVLQGIEMLDNNDVEVTVVLGASAPYLGAVKERAKRSTLQIDVLSDVQNMSDIMVSHDLSIGSGGMTSWERCVLGLPSLTVVLADNQKSVLDALESIGCTAIIGSVDTINSFGVRDGIAKVLKDMTLHYDMVKASIGVCDGFGSKRIVSMIYANSISLRYATLDDCRIYWEWANEPMVRKQSFSKDFIPYATHTKWFEKKIISENSFLFVALIGDEERIGQIRFDCFELEALIDISIDKKYRGLALGSFVLREGVKIMKSKCCGIKFKAEILKDNIASNKIFIDNGFVLKSECDDCMDLDYCQYFL